MAKVKQFVGREILDSRGNPTVLATCFLENGVSASASVPSGASTGAAEAHELRDGDARRYRGQGCRKATDNVSGELSKAAAGREFGSQSELDEMMIALDGTANKSRLGGNAILAASVAFARACAAERHIPLYQHFAGMVGGSPAALPRLTINLFSGGKHAGQQISIQDVLVIPMSAQTMDEALVAMADVYYAAADLVFRKYGMRSLVADEGGLAPAFANVEEMLGLAAEAIKKSGYTTGKDVALGVDVASTHFYKDKKYALDSQVLDSKGMVQAISGWLDRFPIVSVEDGLAEDDWEHWPLLRESIAGRALTLGDDLLCTNPERIKRAVQVRACDALLLKVNQIGTLTEAASAYKQARSAGWAVTLSVRSGETEDDWAADLAVGWRADQFKNGSIRRSERLAKYNRLLEIAETTGWQFCDWPVRG